jgi:Arc/MetJ family transcription regulator
MVCVIKRQAHIMRTNIEIDDALMAQALKAGPFKTKKEAVEAGLKPSPCAAAWTC